MVIDEIIMTANRIPGSNLIDCHNLSFISSNPARRVVQITGPKNPVAPENIVYEGRVLSVGKMYYYINAVNQEDLVIDSISEWAAREIRYNSFVKKDKNKWTPIPLLDDYKL